MFEREIDINEIKDTYDINVVIVTATQVELEAAKSFLKPIDEQILVSYDASNTYYIGIYGKFLCAIVRTNNMGAIALGGALQTTQDAINTFSPKAVIMAGIALGKSKQKQKLGDLLISKSLVFYEQARVNSDGTVEYRGAKPESNRTLLNRFTQNSIHQYTFDGHEKSATVIAGPLLSGEKLIDSAEFKKELLTQFPDAIGGEMEAAGIYSACNNENIPWIILKSICDWADGTKEKSFQKESAHIAFSFLNQVLDSSHAFTSLNMSSYKKKKNFQK